MKVLVTGGTGFLGRQVADILISKGHVALPAGKKDGDLESQLATLKLFQRHKPDAVIHLAAQVGGIGANRRNPGVFWQSNTLIGLNVLDGCINTGVKRVVIAGTTCSYPKRPKTIPFVEEEMFDGYPEETNAPYGIAKRSLIVGAMAYKKQFGLEAVAVVPTNLYGPYDNFDKDDSHVIPALIQKMHNARMKSEPSVMLWGTGKASRDFLYVTDAAAGFVSALDHGASGQTYNLGSGEEVTINTLAAMVAEVVGYKGKILFDSANPDGQPRRCMDWSKAADCLGWCPTVNLRAGIQMTYEWWRRLG